MLYVSKAKPGIDKNDIANMLEKAVIHNKKQGITGLLCHTRGCFAQILEGEELPVLELYVKIAKDPRHSGLVIVSFAPVARQSFQGWAMGSFGDNLNPIVNFDDMLKLRNGREKDGAVAIMQSWLKLLESQVPSGLTPSNP